MKWNWNKDITGKLLADNGYGGTVAKDGSSYYCAGGLDSGTEYQVSVVTSDDVEGGIDLFVFSGSSFETQECASATPTFNEQCSAVPESDTLYIQVDADSAPAGDAFGIILDPNTTGGECGGGGSATDPNTLTIDISAAALGDAEITIYVYDAATPGALVAYLSGVSVSAGAGSFVVEEASSDAAGIYPAGNPADLGNIFGYSIYIEADLTGNGLSEADGDMGYIGSVFVDGDTTVELTDSDFDTVVNQEVSVSGADGILSNGTLYCYFFTGFSLFDDNTQFNRRSSGSLDSEGNGLTTVHRPIVPASGLRSYRCIVDMGSGFDPDFPSLIGGDYTKTGSVSPIDGNTINFTQSGFDLVE